jgi:hypothetical protein
MDKKGMTITLGLLGDKPKMAEGKDGGLLDTDVSSCPLATQDTVVNDGNKRKAEVYANYTDKPVAKCMDCEYFCPSKDMPKCDIAKGMGFCEKFEFMCSEKNGCDEFEVKTEEMEDEESEYEDD